MQVLNLLICCRKTQQEKVYLGSVMFDGDLFFWGVGWVLLILIFFCGVIFAWVCLFCVYLFLFLVSGSGLVGWF